MGQANVARFRLDLDDRGWAPETHSGFSTASPVHVYVWWRHAAVPFVWTAAGASEVEICDYH